MEHYQTGVSNHSAVYDIATGTFTNIDYPGSPTVITGISGDYVVGYYMGSSHYPIIGVLPEPASLALLVLGTLLASRRRHPR